VAEADPRHRGSASSPLCPGPVATGFLASLGDQAAASSIIYRRTADPADVVRAGLRGFDHDAMTVTSGLRTRVRAQGHRFLPRTVMARMTGKMLAPAGR
jgi:short-subunit dehydrogenase